MNEEMKIMIPLSRYEELIKVEAKMQFLKDYVEHETMTSNDLKYYLGIKSEDNGDEE